MTERADVDWPLLLAQLMRREDLHEDQAAEAMRAVMAGGVSPVRLAAFLVALHTKGETVAELKALADVMLENARPLRVDGLTLDIVGTGGDMAHTVNISTMASLVCAGAGAKVVKHGNRASSSSTGTADVLEELGVDLAADPAGLERDAGEAPMTFLFAQVFHPAMRHAAPARRELAAPTAFNFLGPLTNPARPRVAAVGCADRAMAPVMAGVFAQRGTTAAVFRGEDGLDELTLAAPSRVWWTIGQHVEEVCVTPEDVGLHRAPLDALRGGDAAYNADVVRRVLGGEAGAVRDAVVLNAGLALALVAQERTGAPFAGEASAADAIVAGMARAHRSIDSGAAAQVLTRWVARSGGAGPRPALER